VQPARIERVRHLDKQRTLAQRRIGEGMTKSSDRTLVEVTELEAHVQSRLCGQVRDLRLSLQDHGVVLQGRARTYYAKQLAQHAVMEATKLPVLANNIEVC
jgi:hypothetical protein